MRFLFVDRISEITSTTIKGVKNFQDPDPMQYDATNGVQIAPGVISEAVGQLVSWLGIKNNDFTKRPVFLFADNIEIHGSVKPGTSVELEAWIDDQQDDETFIFSGRAYADGKLIHTVTRCSGFFMPLGDLEDPEVTRSRFEQLVGDGLKLEDDGQGYDFDSLIDEVVELEAGASITATKQMKLDEPFYKDHFPRFPVTPIVMINEMIGRATSRLLEAEGVTLGLPSRVANVKIKNFVKPGETCQINVKIIERQKSPETGVEGIATVAEIIKDGKRILRGKYFYDLADT